MTNALPWIALLAIGLPILMLLVLVWRRLGQSASTELQQTLQQPFDALGQRLDSLNKELIAIRAVTDNQTKTQEVRFQSLTQQIQDSLETSRRTINERLGEIQQDNAKKLEDMRKTVDEKLQSTLEERLGASFKIVSERLEQVHRGLGEMQSLASGVGDLKRVLTNVKTRGTWGEIQLEAMIEQVLTSNQYAKNMATRPGSSERVEFAIRFPGRDEDCPVWLPIDAKFPMEDYQRLIEAQDQADLAGIEQAGKALENRIRLEAKTIADKYLEPPHTTDFAVLYLPTEGLYAEVIRRPGLADSLQRDHRVTLAGPTNLLALLNSLQMGFRTLAIEQRSSEVWQVLGQVKTEFGKFGAVIEATEKKLQEASNKFSEVGRRKRAIDRSLKEVEALPIVSAGVSSGSASLLTDDLDDSDDADRDGDSPRT
ncbi:MAG: DNA recombination protein RmuC [Betaproteobacteria bacterium]|nr:DNA recombination protein RmuC [Betaproteobacteria bacterium]